MITVLFFARLREELSCSQLDVVADNISDINDLVVMLGKIKGEQMQRSLLASNVLVAINHELSEFSSKVKNGDEVAFFPPVSGG